MTALATVSSHLLDLLAEARSAEAALRQIDQIRRVIAGPGIFSIQLNVTTARDPGNEVRLQRFYSSAAARWPVNGAKRKLLTPWTQTIFVRGEPFVGEGAEALAEAFDDYEQMQPLGIDAAVNVPLMSDNLCYATFNVFGTRGKWQPHEVLGVRLLALAAMRWVRPVPELMYRFDGFDSN
ncbi:MAG TPA: GAF domain-containing protein [Ramlibacter sp.]|uniref:GAF domain-containing protein n=1 Tax=Ramlibacter sp. TaxID=1917967 RepID=UPI002C25B9B1|nr:GAF domain-containing protein [Ramlibacter sp.]HVZ44706.1 GAF domain-containing protein [Ramlibacter sp.]